MKKQPRKTRRQLQAEKLSSAQKVVNKANEIENPLELLPDFEKYNLPSGDVLKQIYSPVNKLTEIELSWIFDLMQWNMQESYRKSSWGWDADKKKEELAENAARYLIATVRDVKVGFIHFRFDIDDGADVLYCYELQLEKHFRRKGIGTFMMNTLHAIGKSCGVQKVVLTVFKNNSSAIALFVSLGYKPDITNPAESQKVDYSILSKRC